MEVEGIVDCVWDLDGVDEIEVGVGTGLGYFEYAGCCAVNKDFVAILSVAESIRILNGTFRYRRCDSCGSVLGSQI